MFLLHIIKSYRPQTFKTVVCVMEVNENWGYKLQND